MKLDDLLKGVSTVAISGHVKPDGDCAGSTLGTYNYILENYPEIQADIYLEPIPEKFKFLEHSDDIKDAFESEIKVYDLFIALDCGDEGRLGNSSKFFGVASKTLCVDHHISNLSFADVNYIFPESSSASELVFELLEQDKISKSVAECLYMGIAHDTGLFQYSCTSSKTMDYAGILMDKGIDYPKIVDDTYCAKTYEQQMIQAKAFLNSKRVFDDKCIYSVISDAEMKEFNVDSDKLDGIVSALRSTIGIEASVFLYEIGPRKYKVSLRSASYVDCSAIAVKYGGGGHMRAAGVTMYGTSDDILSAVLADIEKEI